MKTKTTARKSNANEVSKSATTKTTAKAVDNSLVEATVEAIRKDSNITAKSGKVQPTDEELAAKQLKKNLSIMDKCVNDALSLTKGELLDIKNWLKVFKKHFDKQFAEQIDKNWATICKHIEMHSTGQFYLEEVTLKNGTKGTKVHMVKFVPTDKIGNKTILATKNLKGFCYSDDEGIISISSADELTIQRMVTEKTPISKDIDGVKWTRYVENVVEKTLKPYEVFELSFGEFKKGVKAAMAIVFPNGFAVSK